MKEYWEYLAVSDTLNVRLWVDTRRPVDVGVNELDKSVEVDEGVNDGRKDDKDGGIDVEESDALV